MRLVIYAQGGYLKCFNPRTREGCDLYVPRSFTYLGVSIHAPAKGATEHYTNEEGVIVVSIHAPAKGATFLLIH